MITNLRVSFLGDSFVQGLGDPEYRGWVGRVLERVGVAEPFELSVFNLGIRRNSSADALARWRGEVGARLLAGADNRLVVSLGSNDAMPGEDGAPRVDRVDFLRNVTELLDGALELGLRVLVVGPPPVVCGGPEHLERLVAVVPELAARCAERGVPFVDVTGALAEDEVWVGEATAADGAHPGAAGYARLAELVLAGGFAEWLRPAGGDERVPGRVVIREARAEDWPAVWPFFQRIVAAGETFTYPTDLTEEQGREWWMLPAPNRTVVAVDEDGTVLGTAKMNRNHQGNGSHVASASYMVDPARAGRGVGRALCRYTLDWARSAGYRAMQFNAVVASNRAAVHLYESLGFEVLGTLPEGFHHPVHGYVGLHVMHRKL
ncbi:GNAT family N-acetyltransferase [Kitasatospora sp. NPDC058965]|uniref:GNAT family N-acetyltransferase n=1 Tax=Kitasatospora sp. NPDC058965 TaxID=3346682 RepID=UPI003679AF5B